MARILVVDDEPLITLMADDWLRELGHEVVGPAHDLQAGLRLAREEIDGAVIDVTLGKDTGYAIADLLSIKATPFIFATGHTLPATDHRQAVAILMKPFEFEEFESAIRAMVG